MPGSIASAPFALAMGEVVSVPCEGKDMHTEIRARKSMRWCLLVFRAGLLVMYDPRQDVIWTSHVHSGEFICAEIDR